MNPRLAASLEHEIESLRLRFQRAVPLLALLLLPGAAIQLAADVKRGLAYLAFALFGVILPVLIDDKRAPHANIFLVALVPILASAVVQISHGPVVALTCYVVPILFCACVVIGTFHFRPGYVLAFGAVATSFYALDYALLIRPALDPALLSQAPYDWTSHATRLVYFLAYSVCAARAVGFAKEMFSRAAAAARAAELWAKYRLDHVVGRGAMGEVWAATYCPEGGFVRPVAVKLIQGRLTSDPAFVDAFRREAELSARLQHKNIVQVLDFGREDERWFLAMEFVDGMSLLALQRALRDRRRRLSPGLALYVTREIVEGVAYAHRDATDAFGKRLRAVHRDVAPANVMVSLTGQVKVTDFGVAWVRGGHASGTGIRGVVGHYGYMSPELVRGVADERSDVYAIGVVLWELLTGTRLFPGRTGATLANDIAQLAAVPPPSEVARELGGGPWDAIVRRALAPDPNARFIDARALGDALADALDVVGWPREDELGALVSELRDAARAERTECVRTRVPELEPIVAMENVEDTTPNPRAPIEEQSTALEVDVFATRREGAKAA